MSAERTDAQATDRDVGLVVQDAIETVRVELARSQRRREKALGAAREALRQAQSMSASKDAELRRYVAALQTIQAKAHDEVGYAVCAVGDLLLVVELALDGLIERERVLRVPSRPDTGEGR